MKGTVVPENFKEMYKCVRHSLNRMELVIFIESGSYIFFFHSSFLFTKSSGLATVQFIFIQRKEEKLFQVNEGRK